MNHEPLFAGIDVGSTAAKAVLLDAGLEVVGRAVVLSGIDFTRAAERALAAALAEGGAEEDAIVRRTATGYGRTRCNADLRLTEISCHARAGFAFLGRACTVLDIGGQDAKVVQVDDKGAVGDFRMNRKCAAGTGSFLEEMSRRLDLTAAALGVLARRAVKAAPLSSFCTVFAMTEVLKRIHEGASPESLALGVYESMAARLMELAEFKGTLVVTGGVVEHHPFFPEVLVRLSGAEIVVPPRPQFAGAHGAALFAAESPASENP